MFALGLPLDFQEIGILVVSIYFYKKSKNGVTMLYELFSEFSNKDSKNMAVLLVEKMLSRISKING